MRYIEVKDTSTLGIKVKTFGMERVPSHYTWGPGIRDKYILHYVIDGNGYFNGNLLGAGDGFLIIPNTIHEYYPQKKNPWKYFWVSFDCTEEEFLECFKSTVIPAVADITRRIFKIPFLGKLVDFIETILPAENTVLSVSSARALSYFYTIVSMHEDVDNPKANPRSIDKHLEAAISYMRNNYHQNIKISDVAHHIFLDDRYFYNIFKKRFGISPKQYLNNIRIERACKLLSSTNLSVSQIGDSIGYADTLAFSVFFKNSLGISPKHYREKMINEKE